MESRLPFALTLLGALALHPSAQPQAPMPYPAIHACPGAFPTDLNNTANCDYTPKQRVLDFATGSVTDEPVLSAVIFGLGAQIIQSPSEWKRTWYGYGMRVGSRYTQAVGKGAATYLVGQILDDDPRFLAYRDDPRVLLRRQAAVCALEAKAKALPGGSCPKNVTVKSLDSLQHDGWQRFGHAWFDVITVRHSRSDGNGARIPAFSRFAGELGGAYAGYPWYPGAENTALQVGERAAGAFGTAALSSFYTEYKPEIGNLLGALIRRGRQPKTNAEVKP
jgi:hypothetical protein